MQISLYRQKNSRYWWMRYTDNGNLVRKSTRCAKKNDTEDIADLEKEKWLRAQGVKIPESLTVGDLCAEVTTTSWGTLKRFRTVTVSSITGRSEMLPITMPTRGFSINHIS